MHASAIKASSALTEVGNNLAVLRMQGVRTEDVRLMMAMKGLRRIRWRLRKDWRNNHLETHVHVGRFVAPIALALSAAMPEDRLTDLTTAQLARLLPPPYTAHSIRRGAAQEALLHVGPESVVTLTLHAQITGLLRYAPMAHRRAQMASSAALALWRLGGTDMPPPHPGCACPGPFIPHSSYY